MPKLNIKAFFVQSLVLAVETDGVQGLNPLKTPDPGKVSYGQKAAVVVVTSFEDVLSCRKNMF